MMPVPQIDRILPELLLVITGVLIMLIEPVMPRAMTRKPIGLLALLGVVAALGASIWQLGLPPGTAFFGTVQTDAFSPLFVPHSGLTARLTLALGGCAICYTSVAAAMQQNENKSVCTELGGVS